MTVIAGGFNSILSPIKRTSRHKKNNETSEVSHTVDQMGFIDIKRIFHLSTSTHSS
jgi:hypothetical protein